MSKHSTGKRKKHYNLGKNIRRIIKQLEKYHDCIPEDIIKVLADPKANYKTERSKLYQSIKTMKESGLIIHSNIKGLRVFFDDEYRTKQYPKPRRVRLNKESELYLRYKKLYRK